MLLRGPAARHDTIPTPIHRSRTLRVETLKGQVQIGVGQGRAGKRLLPLSQKLGTGPSAVRLSLRSASNHSA